MSTDIYVDAEEFWPSLKKDIAEATECVYVQALSFEGDRVGKALAECLVECAATDRRVVADEFYTIHRINDKYLHNPVHWFDKDVRAERDETLVMIRDLEQNGVPVKLTNPSGPANLRAFHRNHKKNIIIDGRVAYIGGFNFSEHNFEWHDMMLRITDVEVVRFLKSDFLATWSGQHLNSSQKFTGMEIYRFDGHTNEKTVAPILDLIASARESIYIESPYITSPFYAPIRKARQNGARVVLVTPENNNWALLKEYSIWESARSGMEIRMYPDRMTHLKAMLIDDKYLIVGSSNFDFLSVGFLQEIMAVITDPSVIEQFKERVLQPDLKKSMPSKHTVGNLKGSYHCFRIWLLGVIFRTVYKALSYGR